MEIFSGAWHRPYSDHLSLYTLPVWNNSLVIYTKILSLLSSSAWNITALMYNWKVWNDIGNMNNIRTTLVHYNTVLYIWISFHTGLVFVPMYIIFWVFFSSSTITHSYMVFNPLYPSISSWFLMFPVLYHIHYITPNNMFHSCIFFHWVLSLIHTLYSNTYNDV